MKTLIRIAALLVVVAALALAYAYREPLVLGAFGVRPFVGERIAGWVALGADPGELDAALGRIHDPKGEGPGSWVRELADVAARHERAAAEARREGDAGAAAEEFRKAAVFYYLARFPFLSSPSRSAAYQRHLACYREAAKAFSPPLERVSIPFEGEEIVAHLRVPPGPRPPVVLFTGGVDTWKSDFDGVIQALLDRGLAVLAMDMPGTGESAWPLAPESDRVFGRVIEHLKTRADVDAGRLGVLMVSFGGWYAVRLALTNPDVKAAVNVGGPVAVSFEQEHLARLPAVMIDTTAHAMRTVLDRDPGALARAVRGFSLAKLLRAPRHRAALLSINGDRDPLVPIEDLRIISRLGVAQDEWIYEGDGHCAAGHILEWARRAASWLEAKLAVPRPE